LRVLLDTTYLLPLIGVEVESVSRDILAPLKKEGHTPLISEISVFELLAKGSKLAAKAVVPSERVSLAIQSLYKDKSINRVSPEEPKCRRVHHRAKTPPLIHSPLRNHSLRTHRSRKHAHRRQNTTQRQHPAQKGYT